MLGDQRRERRAKLLDPADLERAQRQPVIRPAIGDRVRFARRQQGGLERELDRFGTGRREVRLAQRAGSQLGEPREQPRSYLGGMDVAHAVDQARGLFRDRRRDARVRVAGGRDAERGRQIEVAIAVDIGHQRARRALPEDRIVIAEIRDARRLVARELLG